MKDDPEDTTTDDEPSGVSRTHPSTSETSHSVPESADWEQVVQKPLDETASQTLTTTVISAIAAAEGVNARDIKDPPLYDVLDTAALEAAFFPSSDRIQYRAGDASTEFLYRGYRVVVQRNGWVRVYERRDA